uniref:Galanin domain-containing protein n=1 Tax=Oryzias sinensis TaxID=183150 RepID=A0A8C7WSP4_9TELE
PHFLKEVMCLFMQMFVCLQAKEKRGWTLNSAGYLLGPRKYNVHPARRHVHAHALLLDAGLAESAAAVTRRIDHLIQIKDSPSARGRDELVTP